MWRIIYNLLIILALPFFLVVALSKRKIRKNLRERLFPSTGNQGTKGAILIHGASIGEAMIAENLVKYMAESGYAGTWIMTTNTYYTKDLLIKKAIPHVTVEALPFDLPFSVRRFLKNRKPAALIIVETEIWPNLIWQAKDMGLPVIIVNGRISDSTFKNYQRASFFLRSVLSRIDLVLAQSEEHKRRFVDIGMESGKVINTGNIKYYRDVIPPAVDRQKAVVFGSIKERELEDVYRATKGVKEAFPDYRIFIAPREIHLASVIEKDLGSSFTLSRYSLYGYSPPSGTDVVVVDTIGDLLNIYALSAVAFVGGSLAPYGGQNILEPLFFATPVLFGPFMENFKEVAQRVLACNAGITVANGEELTAALLELLRDKARCADMGQKGLGIILEQKQVMKEMYSRIMVAFKSGCAT